jgi:hypothetical protein
LTSVDISYIRLVFVHPHHERSAWHLLIFVVGREFWFGAF